MIFNSIRWRLQAWHGLILLLVLAGFGFSAYQVARDNQLRRIDQELNLRLMSLFRPRPGERGPGPGGPPPGEPPRGGPPGREEPARDEPHRGRPPDAADFEPRIREMIEMAGAIDPSQTNSVYYISWRSDGSELARSANAPASVPAPVQPAPPPFPSTEQGDHSGKSPPPGPPGFPEARTRGEQRELFRFLPGRECILVGRYMAADLAAMHRLALWLVSAGTGILALGLAGGWWLATRAIRPIEEISATATKIASGDLSQRINAAGTDSELGRLAAVLNSTFARLEAAFAHQARFTSDASHELRTPVSVILSQTQTALARERSEAEYREALAACQRAAQRMRHLTESLLELARLDAGQESMKRESFDLARVARDCVELVRPLARDRSVEFQCELPPMRCIGDAERVGQVVTNLLSNAIQFNRDRGQVRVFASAENGTATLTVADTGQGIPAEDLPHIFERFYRVDKSRSRIQGRTGLGLAISKAIVDAHGGSLQVTSDPGSGSIFTVRLPAS
jgi:two-component system, OmpR family, sensor kinase